MLKNLAYTCGQPCFLWIIDLHPLSPLIVLGWAKLMPQRQSLLLWRYCEEGRRGKEGKARPDPAPHLPIRDLSWQGMSPWERDQEGYPSGASTHGRNSTSWQQLPTPRLPQHNHRAKHLLAAEEARGLTWMGRPHHSMAGVLLTFASVLGEFKRNGRITYCPLSNENHKNKENFQCLHLRLQAECLCYLFLAGWLLSILIGTIFSGGELTFVYTHSPNYKRMLI